MGFTLGNEKVGGVTRGMSQAVKRKYLKQWEKVFDGTDPIKKLTDLAEKDYAEFIRLGLAAMPKDLDVDVTVSRFSSWSVEELRHFILTGEYPVDPDQVETETETEIKKEG